MAGGGEGGAGFGAYPRLGVGAGDRAAGAAGGDRRDPDRAAMRPTDPEGFRRAWDTVERLWAGTVERARGFPPERLHESVDGEWSFIQTLRHLAFATDCWVSRAILGDPSPWDALSLPWDGMEETPGVPWDRTARPGLDEALALRLGRMATVRRVVDGLTDESLAAGVETMRAAVARVSLDDAIGSGRSQIEQDVSQAMQRILDGYRSGVVIQGIAIRQADPPAAVNQAFKEVSAAQQEAQSYINQSRAYALQLTAKAQGEAAQFDKIYEQYRLAPEVTRRRMYYETMEQVLSKVDKTIVETGNVTPYLALPEIAKRAPQAQASTQSGTQTAETGR